MLQWRQRGGGENERGRGSIDNRGVSGGREAARLRIRARVRALRREDERVRCRPEEEIVKRVER